MPFARARARRLVAEMGLDLALEDRSDRTGVDAFTRIAPAGITPNAAQLAMLRLPVHDEGIIAALEAET